MLREFSFGTANLAAATKTATATDRIYVNAEAARRIEHGRTVRECAALARRREYDFCLFGAHITPTAAGVCGRHDRENRRRHSARGTS